MKEVAVVTAVAGNYDHIGRHSFYSDRADYIFFTDGSSYPLDQEWQVAALPEIDYKPRLLAKFPKLNPYSIPMLCEYRYVIWIDGSMQIVSNTFVDDILSYMDNGLVLSPHYDGRDCGYGEATIRPPKYENEPLDAQVEFYRSEGFPERYGLYECGVHARDMTVPAVRAFSELWMQQSLDWTIQDQVSCGYCLWKTGLTPDVLPESFRNYNWVHINAHKSEL